MLLVLAATMGKAHFVWPLAMPTGGAGDSWNDSAIAGMEIAKSRWVKLSSDRRAGLWKVTRAFDNLGDPLWPDLTWKEILQLAFKDRVVGDRDHPLVKYAEGRV